MFPPLLAWNAAKAARGGFAAAFAAATALPALLVAQGNVHRGGFIVRLGVDTLAVERYSRSATSLVSEIVIRAPSARRVVYSAALDSRGQVRRLSLAMDPLVSGAAPPEPSRSTLRFRGDTADVTRTVGGGPRTIRVAARPGSMPLAAFSHALVEQAILQARRTGEDSVAFDWVGVGASKAYPAYVTRGRAGSVVVGFFDAPAVARIDKQGRILALDGRASTAKVEVRRVNAPDLERFARSFVAAETARGPMGQLSPRDTVRGQVGPARLMVDYGRPYRRGRVVFGQVVPWDRVWRTGANAATQLSTDTPLIVGGQEIPAGTYSLWTVPSLGAATLIVNRQTGQWGTEYDPNRDLLHVELSQERLPERVEQFTISIEPAGDGGVLRMSWDTLSYVAPFTIATSP